MVKNSFISVISQKEKEENQGSVEFQVFSFTNKIERLSLHLKLHKKTIHLREVCEKLWENVNVC
uniref:ribosomal protein S15 n=1 Tax=Vaccinium floribundum TaxID=180757 RepID=UPI002435454E|nr:ribosomal protein S15 [Vaccinium floribundum]YP_010760705.1 ribosomal protein S15 [Vaccinium floribundum]WEY35002.1 ribosomal protein S15 [Vaccinium floribundum]WEY35021.1 ribosomal protein S15 [Vaccinium floribundum]